MKTITIIQLVLISIWAGWYLGFLPCHYWFNSRETIQKYRLPVFCIGMALGLTMIAVGVMGLL